MTTRSVFHEVRDGAHWAKAWRRGKGSRHEMIAELGGNNGPDIPGSRGSKHDRPDL